MKSKKSVVTVTVFAAVTVIFLVIHLVLRFFPWAEYDSFMTGSYSRCYFDSDNRLLYCEPVEDGIRREYIPLDLVSDKTIGIFLKAEDKRFFYHNGVDCISALRACFQNVKERRIVSGASTITMQLVRIINKDNSKSYKNKFKEIVYAFMLESRLTKHDILELYLNNIPFGYNIHGIASAARQYFSVSLENLNEEQIMLLSIIPRRPKSYDPYISPEILSYTASCVFGKKKYDSIYSAALLTKDTGVYKWPYRAVHLVNRVSELEKNQYRIYTNLDSRLQVRLEGELNYYLESSRNSRIEDFASIVIENSTGKIIAYSGGNKWIDGVQVKNQMGSSMKPFLYALALDQGYVTPSTVLKDIPMEFGSENIYIPFNFNNRFNGPVLFRTSLASSLNIPAVWLLDTLTPVNYLNLLSSLGFNSLDTNGRDVGLGLALGAGEVTLEELAHAFTVFANNGRLISLEYVKSDDKTKDSKEIYSYDTSAVICDILSDKAARVGGFGYEQTFQTEFPSIFKTGTSNQYQNIVAVGSTVEYTCAVWMGNFNGNTVIGKTGSSMPATIVAKVLEYLNGGKSIEFDKPLEYTKREVCFLSGDLPCEDCPKTVMEYVRDDEVKKTCTWHKKEDGRIKTVLPAEYQRWIHDNPINAEIDYTTHPLTIETPSDRSVFYEDPRENMYMRIPVSVTGGQDKETSLVVRYDEEIFEVQRPFIFYLPVKKGEHTLQVQCGKEKDTVTFTVK